MFTNIWIGLQAIVRRSDWNLHVISKSREKSEDETLCGYILHISESTSQEVEMGVDSQFSQFSKV